MTRALAFVLSLGLAAPGLALAASPEAPPLQARWSGSPRVKVQAGQALPLPPAIARKDALRPLSLATADLNRDGAPDLLAGYAVAFRPDGPAAGGASGVLHVYTGNLQAFAPGDDAVYRAIQNGLKPPAFRPEVEVIELPQAPDFLAVGDVDGDGSPDVVTGTRGGSAYVLAGDPVGRLAAPRAIPLDGTLTALAVGQVGRPDLAAEIVIGLSAGAGPALLAIDGASGARARFDLRAEVSEIAIGSVTADVSPDIVAAAGREVVIVAGDADGSVHEGSAIDRTPLPLAAERLALGAFRADSNGRLEVAVLLEDGEIFQLSALAGGPRRPLSASTSIRASRGTRPFLYSTQLSGSPTSDLLVGDPLGSKLDLLEQGTTVGLELVTGAEPVAALVLPPRVGGERDLLVLSARDLGPAAITLAPLAVLDVDRTDDSAAATACTGAPNDCSLRGALVAASSMAGPHTINVPPGTYNLTITGYDDTGLAGDLDVTSSFTTIQGAGASSTIIQWDPAVPPASRDRILQVNPTSAAGFFFSMSGVSLSGGRADFGAGLEILRATAQIVDCVISLNFSTSSGGGLNYIGLGYGDALNVVGTSISRNIATTGNGGGGVFFTGSGGDTLIMIRSTINGNRVVTNQQGGGGLFQAGGSASLTRCNLSFNSTDQQGGGFYVALGSFTATFCRIAQNAPLENYALGAAALNVNDNWWGRNSSLVLGYYPARWLELRHTATPNPTPGNQFVIFTADIFGRNAGGPIAPANLVGLPSFPEYAPFGVFSAPVNGALSGASTQFVDGLATATLATSCASPAGLTATADEQSLSASATVECADLSLFTSGTSGTTCGSGASYLIQVENFGTAAAANVTLTHALPACLTSVACTVDTGPGTCTVGAGNLVTASFASIGAGGQRVIIVSGTLPTAAPGCPSFDSLMSVSTPTPEVSTANNSLLFHTDVACADLSLAKSAPAAVTAGDTLTYTLTSSNQGTVAAQNVAIADPLPAGLRFVSATAVGATLSTPPAGGTGTVTATWAGPTAPGASRALTIVARACSDLACGTPVVNAATTSTSTYDTNPVNDAASATSLVESRSDLSISMSHAPEPVAAGGKTTYTIVVTNGGPSGDVGPVVTDALPAGWTVDSVSVTSGTGSCAGTGTGAASCTLGPLGAAGSCGATLPSSATITLVVNVPVTAGPGTVINAATVASGNCQPDPDASDNVANDPTLVTIVSDMAITKLDSQDPVAASRDLTYTLKVENLGPSRAYGVVVSDPLPSNVRYRRVIAPAGWSCSTPYPGTAGTVSCSSAAPLMPGTYSIGIVVTTPAVCGRSVTLANTATVTSASHDPDGTNNVSSQSTLVTGGPCFLSLPPGGSSDPEPM